MNGWRGLRGHEKKSNQAQDAAPQAKPKAQEGLAEISEAAKEILGTMSILRVARTMHEQIG